ncbi:uncharacterized protein (DUF305 family) [Saccharothrix tamanrassetensis]|uniref:Uncharacterized protein (DUF305 family) n=1 Tax=Saccharothrix tamanrassetensis TaxID=1051531 RepID=A0A841CL50_9PSEU|nr:DUF305 domain-containing protein [Saccharothrix tamanrassetensis]MBB5959222.1 uncharacterized protein (DUF305 family) [Saccharothrix tamanrassetensis]
MRRLMAVLTGLLVLSGCGLGGGGDVAAPTGPVSAVVETNEFNAVDVMFLQMSVPHHRTALEIVKLAEDHPVRAEVKNLASAIEVTQLAEVDSMLKWLSDWKQPESAGDNPQLHAGHGGDHSTSPESIAAVAATASGEFEKAFLNLLIAHQHNAVEMAKLEREGGVNPQAKALAERIFQSRTGQISQMLGYLE